MYKFYRPSGKDTLRKVYDPTTNSIIALIGRVDEMVRLEIIFPSNTDGNGDKWLVIPKDRPDRIREFDSLEEAKITVLLTL